MFASLAQASFSIRFIRQSRIGTAHLWDNNCVPGL